MRNNTITAFRLSNHKQGAHDFFDKEGNDGRRIHEHLADQFTGLKTTDCDPHKIQYNIKPLHHTMQCN
jgi:hypothetical protein